MEHPNLFRRSAAELRHPRCLALTALFISLNIAMDLLGIRIQLTPTIRIGPGFLCNACIGMLFGPFVAMLAGICTDTLGYLVNSGGAAYFPGYMLTAMLGGLNGQALLTGWRITVFNRSGAQRLGSLR